MKFTKKQVLKESVEETVSNEDILENVRSDRKYHKWGIQDAIENVLDVDEDTLVNMYTDVREYKGEERGLQERELNAEEVDDILNQLAEKYDISPEAKNSLENYIINNNDYNPSKERVDNFHEDINSLKSEIENAEEYSLDGKSKKDEFDVTNDTLYDFHMLITSKKFLNELKRFAQQLETTEYNGLEREPD